MSGKEPPRAPVGRVQTGMASFCKPPPIAEQREQQHLEEGQKFKQQAEAACRQSAACSGGSQAQAQAGPSTQGRLRGE